MDRPTWIKRYTWPDLLRLAGGRASGCRVVENVKRCDDDVISDRAA
jgi:hypothetical protein